MASGGIDDTTSAPWRNGPPRRIILATDLSSRCDRALDRAAQLATEWGAKLFILHVLAGSDPSEVPSWRRDGPAEAAARRQVEADLRGQRLDWELLLDHGEPAEMLLQRAVELGCGLVVTGVARFEALGRSTIGAVVQGLARTSPIPLLVVRARPRDAYRNLVVATDFSEPSRHAVECAAALFPAAGITLFHAFRVPFEGFIDRGANAEAFRGAAAEECRAFLPRLRCGAEAVARMRTMLEYGAPEALIGAYVQDTAVDLVVLGTQGRTGLAGFLVGSTARRLLEHLPGDVLLVRGPSGPEGAREA